MSLTEPARRRDGSSRSARDEALVSLPARSSSPAQRAAPSRPAGAAAAGDRRVAGLVRPRLLHRHHDGSVGLIDAIYYATVTITTTGYGDITPVTPHARVLNAIVVTPLRIGFLVLLVGTTLEVLANEGRRMFSDARWRKRMRNHVVVVGYGTKGSSAVETLQNNGTNPAQIVVIDGRPSRRSPMRTCGVRRDRGRRDPARHPAPGRDHQGARGDHHP